MESEDNHIKQAVYNLCKNANNELYERRKELEAAIAEYASSYRMEFNSELPVPEYLQTTLLALTHEETISEEGVVSAINRHVTGWNELMEFNKWVKDELKRIARTEAMPD